MDTSFGAQPEPQLQPLGELLVERGLLTREQLDEALADQAQTNRPLGEIVVKRGWVPGALIGQALATQVGGLVKSEYGFATGFAPLPSAAREPVASPEEEFSARLASLAAQLEEPPTPPVQASGFAPPPTIPLRVAPATEAAQETLDAVRPERAALAEAQRQLSQLSSEKEQLAAELAQLREQSRRQLDEVSIERDRAKQQLVSLASKYAQATVELTQARERLTRLASSTSS